MKTAHFVHGFNVSDSGANTTDRLVPFFSAAGYNVHEHDYGWFGLLQVRFLNGRVAKRVAKSVRPGDIGVGHSNGCAILARAAALVPFDGLVLVNPALDKDTEFPASLRWIHVYHSNGDAAVSLARFLPMHQWGDMGRVGYCGDDGRVLNFDHSPDGHSDIFKHGRVAEWGPKIVQEVVHA